MLLGAQLSPEVAWYGQLHSCTSAAPPVSLARMGLPEGRGWQSTHCPWGSGPGSYLSTLSQERLLLITYKC